MLKRARMIADFQFGRGSGKALFLEDTSFKLSTTRRLRHLYSGVERIATVRAKDGFLTLSTLGARRLYDHLHAPRLRVTVSDEAAPYVAKGGTAFAKHVINVDPDTRAGEEVLVINKGGNLIATGKSVLSPQEMLQMNRGPAVMIRKGIDE
ncbi:MAG: PUA domain-containing protein [Methanotrichaceae archaeon]